MYRKSLADDKGMLFAWGQPSIHTFWMHNTCIPLDMLFIDGDGFIAGIVENAPRSTTKGDPIDCPVNNVLEVPAGWSRRHGVAPGNRSNRRVSLTRRAVAPCLRSTPFRTRLTPHGLMAKESR